MQRLPTTSLAILAAASAVSVALGQNAPAKPVAAPAARAPATPPAGAALPSTDLVGYRLPLLREGSVISRVIGDITLDPDEKHWVFRPIQPESGNLRREFVSLLPTHRGH
jgi:hypothetical protein